MAIWDRIGEDPMRGMLLLSALQQLPQSLSKQNLPPRGAYVPGGYGSQQGGGTEDLMSTMLRMQQMRAMQENQQADNALQQRQFEAQQAAAQQQQEMLLRAAEDYAAQAGLSKDAVYAAMIGKGGPIADALAERLKPQKIGATDRLFVDGAQTVGMAPQYHDGTLIDVEKGTETPLTGVRGFQLQKAAAGAARNLTTVNAYERAYEAKRGEQAATRWQQIQDAGVAAEKRFAQLDALHNLIGDLPTGRLAEGARLQIQKGLAGLGVEVNMDEIGTREAAEKFANTMGVQMLNDPSSGLTGPSSDRDVSIYMELQPGLNMTKQGRQLMLDLAAAERRFETRKAEGLRKLEERKGSLLTPTEQASYEAAFDKQNSKYEDVYKKWRGRVQATQDQQASPPLGDQGGIQVPPPPAGGGLTLSPDVEARLRAKGY